MWNRVKCAPREVVNWLDNYYRCKKIEVFFVEFEKGSLTDYSVLKLHKWIKSRSYRLSD